MHSGGSNLVVGRAEGEKTGGICGASHNPGCITPLAIGLIVGGVGIAVAVLVAVVFLMQRRRRVKNAAVQKKDSNNAERGFGTQSTDDLMSERNLGLSTSESRTTINTENTLSSINTSSTTTLPLSRTTTNTAGSKPNVNIVIPVINRGVSEPKPGEFVYRPPPPTLSPLNALPQLLRYQKNAEVVVDNRPGAESDGDDDDDDDDMLQMQVGGERPPSYGQF